jgi:hypothetical protein
MSGLDPVRQFLLNQALFLSKALRLKCLITQNQGFSFMGSIELLLWIVLSTGLNPECYLSHMNLTR